HLASSNYYHAAGGFYYDYGAVNTGAHYFEELDKGFYVHTLVPGSYYVIDDSYDDADILVREYSLNVKSLVEKYAKKGKDGKADWSNISSSAKKMYEDSNYTQMVDVVHIIMRNPFFDSKK